jgi:hypothetical protein
VHAEVIGVDWAKERVVRCWVESKTELKQLVSSFDVRRRQLEAVNRHVAVGARAAVALKALDFPIQKCVEAGCRASTLLAGAVNIPARCLDWLLSDR